MSTKCAETPRSSVSGFFLVQLFSSSQRDLISAKKRTAPTQVWGAVASPLIKSHNPADDDHRRRSDTRRTGFIGDIGKRPDRHALVRP